MISFWKYEAPALAAATAGISLEVGDFLDPPWKLQHTPGAHPKQSYEKSQGCVPKVCWNNLRYYLWI